MTWITLTGADLEDALNKPQLDILKSARLRSPTRNVAEEALASVVSRIRAEIAASGLNNLDQNHAKIPPELRGCALCLAVESLQLRVPTMEPSAAQEKHADLAREMLLRVAEGKLPISKPDDPIAGGLGRKGASVVKKRASSASSETLKGL